MKNRSLLALVGLVISFALPAFAQQTDKPDPQLRQRLIEVIRKHDDAINHNDADAVAALYTEDAISLEQAGAAFGREAIRKRWVDRFQKVHFSDLPTQSTRIPRTL